MTSYLLATPLSRTFQHLVGSTAKFLQELLSELREQPDIFVEGFGGGYRFGSIKVKTETVIIDKHC